MQAHAEKLVQEMGNASAPTDMIEDVKSEIKFFDMRINLVADTWCEPTFLFSSYSVVETRLSVSRFAITP